jgi:hypothetical protein
MFGLALKNSRNKSSKACPELGYLFFISGSMIKVPQGIVLMFLKEMKEFQDV